MVRHSSPFSGRYLRYVLSILFFAILAPLILWQWSPLYSVLSLLAAAALTVGYDSVTRQIALNKAEGMVNEKSSLIVHAVKIASDRKGYLVITDNFVLFVPLWKKKIKTVLETSQIVRYEFERQTVEITAKFPNKHRTFQFCIGSLERVKQELEEKSGKSLPYKYDKMSKSEGV